MFELKKSNRGFSLLDVIFATGIIVIGLFAVISLLQYMVFVGRLNTDKFVATNLAQEGIEVVRAIRDSNWAAGRSWNDGFPPSQAECQVQYDSASLASYTGEYLKISPAGYYNYTSGSNSKFKRRIIITPNIDTSTPALGNNVGVVSEVTWLAFYGQASVVVEDRLYNWK